MLHITLCSHHDNDNPKRTKRSGTHSRGFYGIPSCFVPSGSRDKAQDTPLQCTLWQGSALCPFRVVIVMMYYMDGISTVGIRDS